MPPTPCTACSTISAPTSCCCFPPITPIGSSTATTRCRRAFPRISPARSWSTIPRRPILRGRRSKTSFRGALLREPGIQTALRATRPAGFRVPACGRPRNDGHVGSRRFNFGRNLLALETPELVRLGIAAGPALQWRPALRGAVANVQAETVDARQFGKAVLLLGLPDLIGAAVAGPELDEITGLAAVGVDAEAADGQAHSGLVVGEDLGGRIAAIHHLQSLALNEFAIEGVDASPAALGGDLQRRLVSLRVNRTHRERQQAGG